MGSGRCQTQTDTKPIAIYVKSYSSCVPIHCRHMNIQLHLNFSSRALPKSCHLHTAKSIVFSVAVWGQNRFYSDRYQYCFFGGASDRDETNTECNMQIGVAWIFWVWEPQTDTKPIAICSEILPFLCTHTPPHAHLAPLQLFLQSLAKEFLCVVQQNKWLSVLQFRTRIVFRIGRLSTFYLQNRYSLRIHISHMACGKCQTQTDTKPRAICNKILPFL